MMLRHAPLFVCLCACVLATAGLPGSVAHAAQAKARNKGAQEPLVVSDLNGKPIAPLETNADKNGKRRATVLLFITNDCPIANSYAPEIQRIYKAYAPQRFAFYLAYVDPALTPAAVRRHVHDYGYTLPALLDTQQKLAQRTGAKVTPEVVVLAPEGKILYRGRIDDRYLDFGKARDHATTHELRDALEALAHDKPVPKASAPAVGCFLPPLK